MAKQIAVITGPSGSGESTITNEIIRRYPDRMKRLVTATTRPPRGNERRGVDYYFFSKQEFLAIQAAGEILEATYIENRDTYYGTYAPDLREKLAAGFVVIVNSDIVGTRFYKERYGATTIFIMPGSTEELRSRLQKRNPEMSVEELDQRAENAKREITEDSPFCDYAVVNADGKLQEAVDEVIAIFKKEGYLE